MARHTTFRYRLNPTVEQQAVLERHVGAARFAFNQSLRCVKTALCEHRIDPDVDVPWTGFDLINSFNAWKKSGDAGRVFAVSSEGTAEIKVTGLSWRAEVCQQVFEEAAVDCSRALAAWSRACPRRRGRQRAGFPRFKRKGAGVGSFRLRNKQAKDRRALIRVGDMTARSVTLPGIGSLAVRDDTRRLRRMIAKGRAKVTFATVSRRADRWWVTLNIEAAELHPAHRHPARVEGDRGGWVGIDRGLARFLVAATADGHEVACIDSPPRPLVTGMRRQRRLAKALSRKQKGSANHDDAAARLRRHHYRIANRRRHFLHHVSNVLVKTHDRLVLEDLNVAGMIRNRKLAQAINDAGWAEFGRQLGYKARWRGGDVTLADRWYPSSQLCSVCGLRNTGLKLTDRLFICPCGYSADRDLNAAINLAVWAEANCDPSRPPDPQVGGRATNARRREGTGQHPKCVGETSLDDAGTDVQTAPAV
jgi:putative transposase